MGKAAILLVAGYSLLLLMSGLTMSDVATQALDNSVRYYDAINVRNIAISGANMACNYVFTNPPWVFGNPWWAGTASPVQFGGGQYMITVDSTSSIDPVTGDRRVTITSVGRYRDSTHVVRLIMRPSNFAKFALYAGTTAAMAAYWETGDSVFGPVHSQGHLKVSGRPYFGGKVTTRNGVDSTSYPGGPHHPTFMAGLENGISIPMNRSFNRLSEAAQSGGRFITGVGGDLYLHLTGDSVTWHRGSDPDTTTYIPDFAPNGALVLQRGNVHLKGVLDGRLTIGALDSSGGTSRGRIILDDDIRYQTDPRVDPSSDDVLGLVAYNDVNIDGDKTKSSFHMQASIFAYKRGVTVEGYNSRTPGNLYTLGGWIVENVFPTSNGVPLGNAGSKGFKASVLFDERFRRISPPYFPTTALYEVLAWYE